MVNVKHGACIQYLSAIHLPSFPTATPDCPDAEACSYADPFIRLPGP